MEITPDFVSAIERSVVALRTTAKILEDQKEAQLENELGQLLRVAIEKDRQAVDLLNGWVVRAKKLLEERGITKTESPGS